MCIKNFEILCIVLRTRRECSTSNAKLNKMLSRIPLVKSLKAQWGR